MKSGIYKITNVINRKFYIGKSNNVKTRLKKHKYDLLGGRHANDKLQEDFDKYGEESFTFELLEECTEDLLNRRESILCFTLDAWNKGYNIAKLYDYRNISLEQVDKFVNVYLPMIIDDYRDTLQKRKLTLPVSSFMESLSLSRNDTMVLIKSVTFEDCERLRMAFYEESGYVMISLLDFWYESDDIWDFSL